MNEKLIQRIVAEVVRRLKALEGNAVSAPIDPPVSLVTEDLVKSTLNRGGDAVYVTANAIVTPLARDLMRQQNVRLAMVGDDAVVQAPQKSTAVAIGADHKGFELKKQIGQMLRDAGREVMDCGVHGPQETSYIDVAQKVADAVKKNNPMMGIVVDADGTGAAIATNRVKGIRAAACGDVTSAKFARAHVDANVLCLGVDIVGYAVAKEIIATWLTTPFEGGQHAVRVREIDAVARGNR